MRVATGIGLVVLLGSTIWAYATQDRVAFVVMGLSLSSVCGMMLVTQLRQGGTK